MFAVMLSPAAIIVAPKASYAQPTRVLPVYTGSGRSSLSRMLEPIIASVTTISVVTPPTFPPLRSKVRLVTPP